MKQKSILQKILERALFILARAAIRRYKPLVVGVTGSVGKTSTKEAIYYVLRKKYKVWRSEKNYNNEIGVPLTILGMEHRGKNIMRWSGEIIKSFLKIVTGRKDYPEILVLEMGVDRPGDIDYLTSIVQPFIGVITAVGEIPVHVEFFAGPKEVAMEKSKLIQALPYNGFAILNTDDSTVLDVKNKTKAKIVEFGFGEDTDVTASNYEIRIKNRFGKNSIPEGIVFKADYRGKTVPIRLNNVFGRPQAYAALAAVSCGLMMNMNLVEIADALLEYQSPPGRLMLLRGIKNSLIIDDSYNASPQAVHEALDLLEALPARRRIAVLGDMLEIGKYSELAHRTVGDKAAKFADLLFTVGPKARFIADEAMVRGIGKNARVLNKDEIFSFDESLEAGKKLDGIIRPGDLILVKGSQSIRMERVVEEIMAEPERAGELLCRQEDTWKK